MTTAGLVILVTSNVAILALTLYCFYRVMTSPNVTETEHAPLDIDTRDVE